jgi:hypothetical protein
VVTHIGMKVMLHRIWSALKQKILMRAVMIQVSVTYLSTDSEHLVYEYQ